MGTINVTAKSGALRKRFAFDVVAPPAATNTMYGGTMRGTIPNNALVHPRPIWDIVRVYEPAAASTILQSNLGSGYPAGPRGRTYALSMTTSTSPGWGSSASERARVAGILRSLPDVPNARIDMCHEFEAPEKYGNNNSLYLSDYDAFSPLVRGLERQYPLTIFRCCMSYSLSDGGKKQGRNVGPAFVSGDYDECAPDVYSLRAISDVVELATSLNKPLATPEFGPLTNIAHEDPAILDEMQRGFAAWDGLSKWVCWFDKRGAGADLDEYPNARAYWAALVGV